MRAMFAILLMCFTGFTLAQDDAVPYSITSGFSNHIDVVEGPEEEADEEEATDGEEESDETEGEPE